MAVKKGGLGRGLDSLIPAAQTTTEHLIKEGAQENVLDIKKIKPNVNQPRKSFDKERLAELADSIGKHGVISPILVARAGAHYEIVAGERRYKAAIMAGLTEVPVLIKDFTQKEILEVSLIENIQREDLNPIEEATGYKRLSEEFHLTQEEISSRVGKGRVAVANAMRLLALPEDVQTLLREEKLSSGQARAILQVGDEEKRSAFARHIVQQGLSVRECEALSKTFEKEAPINNIDKTNKEEGLFRDPNIALVEEEISEKFGAKAKIQNTPFGSGKLILEYHSVEALNDILSKLGINQRGF